MSPLTKPEDFTLFPSRAVSGCRRGDGAGVEQMCAHTANLTRLRRFLFARTRRVTYHESTAEQSRLALFGSRRGPFQALRRGL